MYKTKSLLPKHRATTHEEGRNSSKQDAGVIGRFSEPLSSCADLVGPSVVPKRYQRCSCFSRVTLKHICSEHKGWWVQLSGTVLGSIYSTGQKTSVCL